MARRRPLAGRTRGAPVAAAPGGAQALGSSLAVEGAIPAVCIVSEAARTRLRSLRLLRMRSSGEGGATRRPRPPTAGGRACETASLDDLAARAPPPLPP